MPTQRYVQIFVETLVTIVKKLGNNWTSINRKMVKQHVAWSYNIMLLRDKKKSMTTCWYKQHKWISKSMKVRQRIVYHLYDPIYIYKKYKTNLQTKPRLWVHVRMSVKEQEESLGLMEVFRYLDCGDGFWTHTNVKTHWLVQFGWNLCCS